MSPQYRIRYLELNRDNNTVPPIRKRHGLKINSLLRELSDDDMDDITTSGTPADPHKPWLPGFHLYLNTHDELGDSTIVEWWGVCT